MRNPLTGEQRLSLRATAFRWERDRRQPDARLLADAFGSLLVERDQLAEQRDQARAAVRRAGQLANDAHYADEQVDPEALSEAVSEVDQLCPGCWRLHGTWCHPHGGPMADPDPTAYRQAVDGGEGCG